MPQLTSKVYSLFLRTTVCDVYVGSKVGVPNRRNVTQWHSKLGCWPSQYADIIKTYVD